MQFGARMMQLDFKAEGLNEMLGVLKELERTGSHYSGVELTGMKRLEPKLAAKGITNKDILQWLDEDGRKFSQPGPQDVNAIERAFLKEFQTQVSSAIARAQKAATGFVTSEKWSRNAAGRSLKAAIEEWMKITARNIEQQTAAEPLSPLSEKYKKWKQEKYGFTTIGKLTGQLLENLSTAVSAARIKLTSK